jgi:dihydropteroate synthase
VTTQKSNFKRLGVLNCTPNSFSDGGEYVSIKDVFDRIQFLAKNSDAIDVGAESTAPTNEPISADEEWERLRPVLPFLKKLALSISIDTYHPETIDRIGTMWIRESIPAPLIWNDVSGKFDPFVKAFLGLREDFQYVFCHNLAPIRELSIEHMKTVSENKDQDFLHELAAYFLPYIHHQVIFDPTLGFSKTYEQNWYILEHFSELQKLVPHDKWLLGFSRKSFLRKKFGIEKMNPQTREELDLIHGRVWKKLSANLKGTIWVRTHRPELI